MSEYREVTATLRDILELFLVFTSCYCIVEEFYELSGLGLLLVINNSKTQQKQLNLK